MARNDFVRIREDMEGMEFVRVGRDFLLSRVSIPDRRDMVVCFVQYMDFIKLLHGAKELCDKCDLVGVLENIISTACSHSGLPQWKAVRL